MALSAEDRILITELLSLHGHLFDSGALDRLPELFTADVVYDVTDLGGGTLRGVESIRDAALAMGDRNPVGHHITNVILEEVSDGEVRALSKGIGVRADGGCGSITYEDVVVRADGGWRIGHRKAIARRVPLGAG